MTSVQIPDVIIYINDKVKVIDIQNPTPWTVSKQRCGPISFKVSNLLNRSDTLSIVRFDTVKNLINILPNSYLNLGNHFVRVRGSSQIGEISKDVSFMIEVRCRVETIKPSLADEKYTYKVSDPVPLVIMLSQFSQDPDCGTPLTYSVANSKLDNEPIAFFPFTRVFFVQTSNEKYIGNY